MAYYTRTEFAEKCGLKKSTARAYIASNIKRGRIILSGKLIDDTLPENAYFLEKQIENNKGKQHEEEPNKPKATKPKLPPIESPERPAPEEPDIDDSDTVPNNAAAIDRKIKQQNIQKQQVEIRLLEIREEKLRGEVVPTEFIKDAFARYSQILLTGYDNTLDKIFAMATKKFKISNEEMVKFRTMTRTELNKTVLEAGELAKADFKKIVAEHKDTRGRGERK